jgi:3',5'-cyclic AMP phosphodiesterase CpdA
MPLILHLSDIHLGRAALEDVADDYKDEFVPLDERIRRQGILYCTLEDLPRTLDAPLDAVIVSGDITIAGKDSASASSWVLRGRIWTSTPAPSGSESS